MKPENEMCGSKPICPAVDDLASSKRNEAE